MTDIIIGERGSGKTTELIKRSAETGSVIVTADRTMAHCIHGEAIRMGYNIVPPMTMTEYLKLGQFNRIPILIDEFDLVLRSIIDFKFVDAVTITKRDYQNITYLKSLNKKKEEEKKKNNRKVPTLDDDETRRFISTLIIKDGTDTGISGVAPGYLINKLEETLNEILEWQIKNSKGE